MIILRKKLLILLCGLMALATLRLQAQSGIVSVNNVTGTANINVPIYTVNAGQLVLPVSLFYNASGVKVKDIEGTAGMNWNLSAGGQISRNLRGLPDDCKLDQQGSGRSGWMYSSVSSTVSSFAPSGSSGDATYIQTYFPYYLDTEPDIFSVSAPGLSCQLVYDNVNSKFITVDHSDIKVSYTVADATSGRITAFTITNDKGVKYIFDAIEGGDQKAVAGLSSSFGFHTTYNQYVNDIVFINNWKLSSMTDINNNKILLYYTTDDPRPSSDPVTLNYLSSPFTVYTMQSSFTPILLDSIGFQLNNDSYQTVSKFTYGLTGGGQKMVSQIKVAGRNYVMSYSNPFYYNSSRGLWLTRNFLTSINETSANSPVLYQFSYLGGTGYSGQVTIPDSTSTSVDYWGYYNGASNTSLVPAIDINPSNSSYPRYRLGNTSSPSGSYSITLTGANRAANADSAMLGTLNKITYATGGTTTLTYESNDYYDPVAATVIYGGGIRVKSIVDYDGLDTSRNMKKTYSYLDPATGYSSGTPVTLPVFAYTIPYNDASNTTSAWTNGTVRSENDLSDEDHSILYSSVTVKQKGAGSTYYEYKKPGMNWDTSAPSGDWAPTYSYAYTSASGPGHFGSDYGTYPFAPNVNFDFERGLITKQISYNEASTPSKVQEVDYTYTRTNSPYVLPAVRWDVNNLSNAYQFSKYNVYANVDNLVTQAVTTVYDSNTQSTHQASTVNYTYGSSNHKLLTQQQTTNSDGTQFTTNINYVKDYTIPSGATDSMSVALKQLQTWNVNVPVEQYQQRQPSGGSLVTVGGSLTKFKVFPFTTGNLYLPSQNLSFISAAGSSFTPASVNSSTGVFGYQSGYFVTSNNTAYDYAGMLQTKNDNNRHMQSTLVDHNTQQPVAAISNAAAAEIAFSDFDSKTTNTFAKSGTTTLTTSSRSGKYALSLASSDPLSATIVPSSTSVNYIFSCWINTSSAGTGYLTLTNSSSGTTTANFSYTTGGWKYYEKKISVSSMSNPFTVAFQTNTAVTVDDVLFYPEYAQVSTAAYDPLTKVKTSVTNTNGVSEYYSRDVFGRLLYRYDQDKNIVERMQYNSRDDASYFVNTDFGMAYPYGILYTGTALSFTPYNFDNFSAVVTYTWNFGDGSTSVVTTSSAPQTHTYTTAGDYTVSINMSCTYGTSTTSLKITVLTAPPPEVTVYFNNASTGGSLASIDFYNGTTLVKSITAAQIGTSAGTITAGSYTIKVHCGGSSSDYASVYSHCDSDYNCSDYFHSNSYTFSMDLTSATYFTVELFDTSCE